MLSRHFTTFLTTPLTQAICFDPGHLQTGAFDMDSLSCSLLCSPAPCSLSCSFSSMLSHAHAMLSPALSPLLSPALSLLLSLSCSLSCSPALSHAPSPLLSPLLSLLCSQAIGFDMDYTLAQYRVDTFEALAHKQTIEKLVRGQMFNAVTRKLWCVP